MKRRDADLAKGVTPTLLMQSSEIPAENAERARRTIAANATDVDDARTLLEMLGLLDTVAAPAAAAPGPAKVVPVIVEWIDTPGGRFRKCAGECGQPVRLRTEPPTYHAKRVEALGMCAACFRSHQRSESQEIPA